MYYFHNRLRLQTTILRNLECIRKEKRRLFIITKARIHPFCRASNINLGYYDGTGVFPRSVTDKNNAMFLHSNHFCLVWKSENVIFNKAIKELKGNFKIADQYITEENVKSRFEEIYTLKKLNIIWLIFFVNDLETHETDRARPYVFCFYRLSNLAKKYNHDLTPYQLEKFKKVTIAFDGDNCVTNALDFCLKLKREERKLKNKLVEHNLQLHAHNGSGFDRWIILNNLSCDKHIVNIIKNGNGIIESKLLIGYIEKKIKTSFSITSF